jgi:hypothetical protein
MGSGNKLHETCRVLGMAGKPYHIDGGEARYLLERKSRRLQITARRTSSIRIGCATNCFAEISHGSHFNRVLHFYELKSLHNGIALIVGQWRQQNRLQPGASPSLSPFCVFFYGLSKFLIRRRDCLLCFVVASFKTLYSLEGGVGFCDCSYGSGDVASPLARILFIDRLHQASLFLNVPPSWLASPAFISGLCDIHPWHMLNCQRECKTAPAVWVLSADFEEVEQSVQPNPIFVSDVIRRRRGI